MEDGRVLITNIQRFSLHDGPGIRTTVFTKGCPLVCPWCSNPENMNMVPESYVKDGIEGTYGRYLSCDEIYNELIKDKLFYGIWDKENISLNKIADISGGITFSGGESLLWSDRLQPLWKLLQESHIHMAVETALMVPGKAVETALKFIDLFYVDIKILDVQKCRTMIKGDVSIYFSNLDLLFSSNLPVIFRVPVIGGYTDSNENRDRVIDVIKAYHPIKVELIKGHSLGSSKYLSLGKTVPEYYEVSDCYLKEYWEMIQESGIETEICKIC